MLTINQCKDNAYAIAQVMQSNISIVQASRSINNICNLETNSNDIKTLIRLRVNHVNFDQLFAVWENNG